MPKRKEADKEEKKSKKIKTEDEIEIKNEEEEAEKSEEEEHKEKIEITINVPNIYEKSGAKILDCIATVCQFNDKCVAAGFDVEDNRKLIVTANSLHHVKSGSGEANKLYQNITSVLYYFTNFLKLMDAPPEQLKSTRTLIALNITSEFMDSSHTGSTSSSYLPTHFKAKIISDLMATEALEEQIIVSVDKQVAKNAQVRDSISLYVSTAIHCTNAMKKIEKSLLAKTFNFSGYILNRIEEKDVHAEIRQVASLYEKDFFNKKYNGKIAYIGISKNCCLCCHFFLNAIKSVSKNKELGTIAHRETVHHDLSSIKKWRLPAFSDTPFTRKVFMKFYDSMKEYAINTLEMRESQLPSLSQNANISEIKNKIETLIKSMYKHHRDMRRNKKEVIDLKQDEEDPQVILKILDNNFQIIPEKPVELMLPDSSSSSSQSGEDNPEEINIQEKVEKIEKDTISEKIRAKKEPIDITIEDNTTKNIGFFKSKIGNLHKLKLTDFRLSHSNKSSQSAEQPVDKKISSPKA